MNLSENKVEILQPSNNDSSLRQPEESKNDSATVNKMCDRIIDAGNKMNRLVNDLLESARKDASKVALKFDKLGTSQVSFCPSPLGVITVGTSLVFIKHSWLRISIGFG